MTIEEEFDELVRLLIYSVINNTNIVLVVYRVNKVLDWFVCYQNDNIFTFELCKTNNYYKLLNIPNLEKDVVHIPYNEIDEFKISVLYKERGLNIEVNELKKFLLENIWMMPRNQY